MSVFKQLYISAKWSVRVVLLLIGLALLGDFIANQPQKTFLPPLIPYSATYQDAQNLDYISPLAHQNIPSIYYRHWLGTDKLGRDVLSGVISGTRTALLVGVGGTGFAIIIGLLMGGIAGYFGNKRYQLSWLGLILRGCMIGCLGFYTLVFFQQNISLLWLLGLFMLIYSFIKIIEIFIKNQTIHIASIAIPLDSMIMRIVEILQSVPPILWLLGLVAVTGRFSIGGLMGFIGFIGWTSVARLVRGEVLKVRPLEYVEIAEVLGFSDFRILLKHILPNILTAVFIAASFGIANSILLEAFLTFSGMGLPIEQVTWGSLLNAARDDWGAWWVVVFPGLAIFITVTAFNRIGEVLRDRA